METGKNCQKWVGKSEVIREIVKTVKKKKEKKGTTAEMIRENEKRRKLRYCQRGGQQVKLSEKLRKRAKEG